MNLLRRLSISSIVASTFVLTVGTFLLTVFLYRWTADTPVMPQFDDKQMDWGSSVDMFELTNAHMTVAFRTVRGSLVLSTISNLAGEGHLYMEEAPLFELYLANHVLSSEHFHITKIDYDDKRDMLLRVHLTYEEASGFVLHAVWTATLKQNEPWLRMVTELTPGQTSSFDGISLFRKATYEGDKSALEYAGKVDGVPVVFKDEGIFMAIEHPLFTCMSTTDPDNTRISKCLLKWHGRVLHSGDSLRVGSVFGVFDGARNVRRAFARYLDAVRLHPAEPWLHYNSWYHLRRPGLPDTEETAAMTAAAVQATIVDIKRELETSRGALLRSFLLDDGWDDYSTIWKPSEHFPNGFTELSELAAGAGAGLGLCLSPTGGSSGPIQQQRVKFAESAGYEIRERALSLTDGTFFSKFLEVCMDYINTQGVNFLKFDEFAAGKAQTATFDNDVFLAIRLFSLLSHIKPDLRISLGTGAWASPFWLMHVDSLWRGDLDVGRAGSGSARQQWVTYRDSIVYQRVLDSASLLPIHALALRGVIEGHLEAARRLDTDDSKDGDKDFAVDVWMLFGSGVMSQELFVTPDDMNSAKWDLVAAAAKWAQTRAPLLVDSHWVGGDPAQQAVYGYASYMPTSTKDAATGTLVLRNPSDKKAEFKATSAEMFEPPAGQVLNCKLQLWINSYAAKSAADMATLLNGGDGVIVGSDKPAVMAMEPWQILIYDAFCRTED